MITKNEKKVLRFLFSLVGEDCSVNEVSRQCNLSPNGAFKILKKLEKEKILIPKKISSIKFYKLDFENPNTKNFLELALSQELTGRVKFRADDLNQLKELTYVCIIFGSYIDLKKSPKDMDVAFILDKNKFNSFKNKSSKIYQTIPIKVHDVLQTKEDFAENLAKRDKILLEIIKKGIILWGQKEIIGFVESEYKR